MDNEEIEQNAVSEVVQKEEIQVDFDQELEQIYQAFLENDHQLTESLDERIKKLVEQPKDIIDAASYIKVMFMKGKKYDGDGNRNAARFCAMRMLWIRDCYEGKRKKNPRFLDMIPFTFTDGMNDYTNSYTDFLEDTYRAINKKLLMITAVLFLIVFAALAFLVRISIPIAAIEAIILGALNYWLQKRRLPDMFQKNQTRVLEDYVEAEILDFDRPIRIM